MWEPALQKRAKLLPRALRCPRGHAACQLSFPATARTRHPRCPQFGRTAPLACCRPPGTLQPCLPCLPALLLVPQFVLTTDPSVGSMAEQLQYVYASLFVELVVKNPLYMPGEPFL